MSGNAAQNEATDGIEQEHDSDADAADQGAQHDWVQVESGQTLQHPFAHAGSGVVSTGAINEARGRRIPRPLPTLGRSFARPRSSTPPAQR